MLINEVRKRTKLTKKAIEYYTLQGLVSPSVLENGYRNYNEQDIENLNKISILRRLDLSTEEIHTILKDTTNSVLQSITVKKALDAERAIIKQSLLQKLSQGVAYDQINIALGSLEQNRTIIDKLLDAFPGYYGRFICMHFAQFLNEPIQTESQEAAYETILSFLDNLPDLDMPSDLEAYLIEGTKHMGAEQITQMLESTQKSIQNPDDFLANNKEVLDTYLAYRKSDAYTNSPAFKLMKLMEAFNRSSGYNDVFIPAMKELSDAYASYYQQLEVANQKFLKQYPEIEKFYNSI